MGPQLTIVILTLNEADRIARCLQSVPFNSYVVLIDSESTDGTLASARAAWEEMGRNPSHLALVTRPWPGFVEARNESLKWVNSPWVLWLDADEWITPELTRELTALEKLPTESAVFQIPRQSWFLGRMIRYGGWYPDRKRRLARTGSAQWTSGPFGAAVHENLCPLNENSPIATLQGHLGHEPFRNEADQTDTNEKYSSLLAKGLAEKWRTQNKSAPSAVWIDIKVFVKFIENYFWKRGFLDGRAGLKIALGSCTSLRKRLEKASALLASTGL